MLAFAQRFPGAARRLVSVSGSQGAAPFAIALRSVQREAILRDPAWRNGHYAPDAPPRTGLALARKLGTITYRSAGEWQQRFGRGRIPGRAHAANSFAPEFGIEATQARPQFVIRRSACIFPGRWTASTSAAAHAGARS